MADIQPCCGTPQWSPQRQWRTYAWTGSRFNQTAGPTKFGTDPRLTDLTLSASDLVLGPADTNGRRTGSVTVTVTNKGPVDVPRLGFGDFFTIGEPAGGDLARCRTVSLSGSDACLLDDLPVGKRRTYTFRFLVDLRPERVGSRACWSSTSTPRGGYWNDLKPKDNHVAPRRVGGGTLARGRGPAAGSPRRVPGPRVARGSPGGALQQADELHQQPFPQPRRGGVEQGVDHRHPVRQRAAAPGRRPARGRRPGRRPAPG